jgi:hypothetical protein
LLFGFINLPPKKLRIKVLILSEESSPVPIDDIGFQAGEVEAIAALPAENIVSNPVVSIADLTPSINYAINTFRKRFNTRLISFSQPIVEILPGVAPDYALTVNCNSGALRDELGRAGNFFNLNRRGGIFTITVFIVRNIRGKDGCSLGPASNYVTVDIDGVNTPSTLAHEIGHATLMNGFRRHNPERANLMYAGRGRGDGAKRWQRNFFRSSRFVTYL